MTVPLEDGVYSIRPFKDIGEVIEVAGRSKDDYAETIIHAPNGGDQLGNFEKFYLTTDPDTNYSHMIWLHSGKCMAALNGGLEDGKNIVQVPYDASNGQLFVLSEDTTISKKLNGVTIHPFKIAQKPNTGYVFDAEGGSTTSGTHVRIYHNQTEAASQQAQRWFFVKDGYYTAGSIPSNIGVSTSDGGERLTTITTTTSSCTFFPTWICDGSLFQLRYRIRKYNGAVWDSWGNWKSRSGSTEDEGWGDVWDYSESPTSTELQKWGDALTVSTPWALASKYEMQIQVRRFDDLSSSPIYDCAYGHGNSAQQIITIVPEVEITCDGVEINKDGLKISLNTDVGMNISKWTVRDVTVNDYKVCNDFSWVGASGVYTVSWEDILYIPADGSECDFIVEYTDSQTTTTFVFSGEEIVYATGSMTPKATVTISGTDGKVTYSEAYMKTRRILAYKQHGEIVSELVEDDFKPPFEEFTIYIICETSSKWGIKTVTKTLAYNKLIWSSDGLEIECGVFKSIDALADKFSRDSDAILLGGKTVKTYYGELGGEADCSVSDCVVDSTNIQDMELLRRHKYVLFRAPGGLRVYVYITDVEIVKHTKSLYLASITQKETA